MAAGLGFKDFVTGEVLTAVDVDGYLMQGIWVFASAAARDAAVTSPQEGNFAYLKDTNITTYYTGSAWANLDTTGMTNPMTTTGDTIYSSSGSTPARLGIGSTGQVLTVAGGVPSWATPAGGGGKVLQVVSTAKTDAFSTATAAFTDVTGLSVTITPTANTSKILVLVTLNASARDGQGNSGARIVRGSTDIFIGDTASNRVRVTTDISRNDVYANKNFGLTYLDSPATTSATTYKVQVSGLPSSSGWTTYVNRSYDDTDSSSFGRSASSITVLEIGA